MLFSSHCVRVGEFYGCGRSNFVNELVLPVRPLLAQNPTFFFKDNGRPEGGLITLPRKLALPRQNLFGFLLVQCRETIFSISVFHFHCGFSSIETQKNIRKVIKLLLCRLAHWWAKKRGGRSLSRFFPFIRRILRLCVDSTIT